MVKYAPEYTECERIITDVSYRGDIAAPIDTFFKFKNKALVSATTLPYSDPRFEDFERVIIKPDFNYQKPLSLIATNNVISSVKGLLDKLASEHVCIFFNSTMGINAIVKNLGIATDSRAYCAQESVVKLMTMQFKHANSEFKVKDMSKHNFFTSRYFSAIDIKLDYKPDVIIVSDIFFANHSIVDPHTEVIQIAGRFRNGINSLTHITNFNPIMEVMTDDEILSYIDGCLDTHEDIVAKFRDEIRKGSKETLEFFIKNSPVAGFFTEGGARNHFMIDNSLNEERVKRYYTSKDNLVTAYADLNLHFEVSVNDEEYTVGDDDMYRLARQESKLGKSKYLAHLLQRYTSKPGDIRFVLFPGVEEEQATMLKVKYPLIAEAVRLVGVEALDKTNYEHETLRRVIREANAANQVKNLAPQVHEFFEGQGFFSEKFIVSSLTFLYAKNKINGAVYASYILKYYDGKRTTHYGENGYILTSPKDLY